MELFKTLDVAIGIAFLFLILTFVASATVELISTIRNWRAQMLHDAIGNILRNSNLLTVAHIYDNPLVVALGRDDAARSWVDLFERFGWRRHGQTGSQPSYIPAATFSGAVLDGLIGQTTPKDLSPDGTIQALRQVLANNAKPDQKDALRSVLETTLAVQGSSVQAVKLAIEKWYNDTMDRVTGWYKRRTQSALLIIGLTLALGGNIDIIGVTLWLWQGDAARQAVVSAATDYVHQHPLPLTAHNDASGNATPDEPKTLADFGAKLIDADRMLLAQQYPIGWPHAVAGPLWLIRYLIGSLITAVAISMGSSFWFDALQGLIKIRGAGVKPGAR
jgi:hypothetical protein